MSQPNHKTELTTGEAARRLGVTTQAIRNWIDAGLLEARRVSTLSRSNYMITIESIQAFEEQRQKTS